MTIQDAYTQLLSTLYIIYGDREAANIADWVIEKAIGKNKINRILNKSLPVSPQHQELLQKLCFELASHKPVQYVLNEAWFAGLKFYVNEHVLIPRPETEELVDWIANDIKKLSFNEHSKLSLIDVGTGSGCIPIALKKQLPFITVTALDVSGKALDVAKKNAADQQVQIDFIEADFLNKKTWTSQLTYDVIVSNPPYIKQMEAATMAKNVLHYEPEIALFVPDEDALVFYKALAFFAHQHLHANGSIYVEINEALGEQVMQAFINKCFTKIELKKDLQGKDRMIKAGK